MSTPPSNPGPAPYRSEIDSLEARKRVLETELQSVDERLEARRKLPLLDSVRVASPCPAKWDEMIGDERKRFCLSCDKHVFNISAMAREDAEQFLAAQAGGEVCIRYYQRADGTIMTSDCAVGVKKKQRKKAALALAGAGAVAFGAMASMFERQKHHPMTGAVAIDYVPPPEPTPVFVTPPVDTSTSNHGRWVGGAVRAVDPTVTAVPVEPNDAVMGRRVIVRHVDPPKPKSKPSGLPANRQ